MPGGRVDFVGVDIFGESLFDGLVKTGEQLDQSFASSSVQHGQAIVFVGSGGDTTNGTEHPDGDFAVGNQFREVGEGRRDYCGVLRDDLLV
jgi:hypothetical protein